ncbi:filamentous hemagglutinin N-terminal domain-containing protein [Iningainema tapete]|uniref:Filamentous hemagglutinin N-terminal domain-containing protein n=1 Tax=Iningainema tapete BLCC-T55 TaxID=2748662 RepID=A0A8J7BXC4_9CYAN|nr:filamentous hemagglutinin N-terminal domain-containing protein [Iningainema tapete]MBD2772668.1 filamentous hemagglutinin N-terminal domain-containing protein [Iningainema tapete BLCC-T55]
MAKVQLRKHISFRFWTFSGSALFWLLASYPAGAQTPPVAADTTLPINSIVTPGNIITITEGTQVGGNLFHSFTEFSVPTGNEAHFNINNAPDIQNIITRVTGGNSSNIDGLIKVIGNANLFLINPNGIVFGPNAKLEVGGSFVASTANSIRFADGTEFSATNPQAPPLLTINVPPVGFQFGSNPKEIVNQSGQLQVPEGKTLALVGGNVSLEGGNLSAPSGRIELGSVGTGVVNLTQNYALEYSGVQNFQDIQLSKGAGVIASGQQGQIGGNIQVRGRKINLTDGAFIETISQGQGQSGNVLVKATDAVELSGTVNGTPGGLFTQVTENATGKGGNLTIETGKLRITDGAVVDASTFGKAQAGDVQVTTTDVELVGVGPGQSSGIFAQVANEAIDNAGNAGTLKIDTQRLTVLGGAQISTAARKGGNGGELTIKATDSVTLSGTSPNAQPGPRDTNRSGIFVSAEPGARGNVGNLNINTRLLTVENGAQISANNFGTGNPGSLTLDVRQLTIQNGGLVRAGSFNFGAGGTLTVKNAESVNVIGSNVIGTETEFSTLSAAAPEGSGNAGDLDITTRNLNIKDGAIVSVSSTEGQAGNLTVTANDVRLDKGNLTAKTAITGGDGGANIILKDLDFLLLQNDSLISARATGDARGGNITINPDGIRGFVVAPPLQNSDIVASAERGPGGNITINARQIFGLTEGKAIEGNRTNDIDASSQFNNPGTVILNTPDVDPSRGLVELPIGIVNTPELVATGCAAFADQGGSSFTVTGRGGLPPSPDQPLSNDVVWTDTRLPISNGENQRVSNTTTQKKPQKNDAYGKDFVQRTAKSDRITIAPATGWVFNGKGEVTLISSASNATVGTTPASCAKY